MPVIDCDEWSTATRKRPLIVEKCEGTTLVSPDIAARIDAFGNIILELDGGRVMAPHTNIDPIRLEALRNAFDTIADEMARF